MTKNVSTNSFGNMGGTSEDNGGPASGLELRCVLAVVRHGDRTPKLKTKIDLGEVWLTVDKSLLWQVALGTALF